jgi:hypothetical protein
MIEEHGAGKQLFRLRAWPAIPRPAIAVLLILGLLAAFAAYDQAWLVALVLALGVTGIALITRAECAKAMQAWNEATAEYAPAEVPSSEVRFASPTDRAQSGEIAS